MNRTHPEPPLSRIPGTSQVREQHAKDLTKLRYHELLEMRDRQIHLLASKKRLQQLPDKGKRIQESYDKLLVEIKHRQDVEEAAQLLGDLNIAAKGKERLNQLEWHGRTMTDDSSHVDDVLDSDDEQEMDPLRVIAQGTMHERQVKILPPPKTLITADDLADIASFRLPIESPDSALADQSISSKEANESVAAELIEIDAASLAAKKSIEADQHTLYLIEKTEVTSTEREKFKPFRTTVSNVHDPDKERIRKKGKHWENTAATPPLIQHKEIQLVPLSESANLQVDFMQKVKELRVARQNKYRDPQVDYLIEGKQRPSEANEVHDPATAEKVTAGINYTVYE